MNQLSSNGSSRVLYGSAVDQLNGMCGRSSDFNASAQGLVFTLFSEFTEERRNRLFTQALNFDVITVTVFRLLVLTYVYHLYDD